ncbi:prepilin peptidase [Halobacteriales archaeon Cl-PHB]
MIASVPDLLRLVAVPFFGYVAWRDVKTRRVPNQTWYPLAALAFLLLAWESYTTLTGGVTGFEQRRWLIRVAVSVGLVIPLAYLFWLVGGFGGADAKAFFVLALLFPTYPALQVAGLDLPVVETTLGVFSLTVLSNTVLVGLVYPLLVAARNAVSGHVSPGMFVATTIAWDEAPTEYGSLMRFPDRSLLSDLSLSGLRSYFGWRGLDLDALRMYLQWRGATLNELRADPERYRDPASLPEEGNDPGDGSLASVEHPLLPDGGEAAETAEPAAEAETLDDPWGAETFLADIDSTAYGTSPDQLRDGLDALTSEDVVWISPGIPFLVPLFGGLLVSLTAGDLLFAILQALGLA